MIIKFNNGDLKFDIEKILSFDLPITIAKSFDDNLDYPYGLDVEDSTYWYANLVDRDNDFNNLKVIFPNFFYLNN